MSDLNDFRYPWHWAVNRYNTPGSGEFRHWMYEAMSMAGEAERLPKLFAAEREGRLPKVHQQCSMSQPVGVQDNHLSCALGVECRECPHLAALETAAQSDGTPVTPDQIDIMKSWTCISHLLAVNWTGKDNPRREALDLSEGYITTVDDRMFWDRTYANLAAGCDEHNERYDHADDALHLMSKRHQ